MWIHIVIFLLIFGGTAAWKAGWLPLEGITDKKSRRLFFILALGGNCIGLFLTAQKGEGYIVQEGYRLEKKASASQKDMIASINGKETIISIQIPEKETEEIIQQENGQNLSNSEPDEGQMVREAIASYNEQINSPDYYYLPKEWEGNTIEWEEPYDRTGGLAAGLSLFAAVVVMLQKAREEQEKRMKRAEQLLMDYPSLVMKFTLLIQAGMTVRKAFQKISMDYKRRFQGNVRWAYEEITAACNEMDSGVSEAEAYRRFGERCAQIKYKTFATLLIQNLQKGSQRMSDMLEKESLEAWEERKRKARVLGEAAATKLLLPMAMMLMVVMAVIMIPAFLSFYL